MARSKFNTVPTELLEHAEAAWEYFHARGYSIAVEPQGKLHYPSTPPMVCKRSHTEIAVLIYGRIDVTSVKAWVATARNVRTDFRIAVCINESTSTKEAKTVQLCQQLGVGILVSGVVGVAMAHEPLDQGINVSLPDLSAKPRATRRALGAAYEHFEAGRWREGFDESCRCLEQLARPYIVSAARSGRLTMSDHNGHVLTATRLERMTIGQLAYALGSAPQQNQSDDLIQRALKQINPDRVNLTHKNKRASTEKKLRTNVGIHLLAIIRAVDELTR